MVSLWQKEPGVRSKSYKIIGAKNFFKSNKNSSSSNIFTTNNSCNNSSNNCNKNIKMFSNWAPKFKPDKFFSARKKILLQLIPSFTLTPENFDSELKLLKLGWRLKNLIGKKITGKENQNPLVAKKRKIFWQGRDGASAEWRLRLDKTKLVRLELKIP